MTRPSDLEEDRIPTRSVVLAIVIVIGLTLAVLGYVALLARRGPSAPTPRRQDQFQTGPGEAAVLRARQQAVLARYGWVDRARGLVRIPIERAMDLVLARDTTEGAPVIALPLLLAVTSLADVTLTDGDGRAVRVRELFDDPARPVVLTFAYFRCPTLCSLVLRGTAEALRGSGLTLGRDVRAITVSIDPRDRPAEARRKQDAALAAAGAPDARDAWTFLVGDVAAVRALADSVGFTYRFDPATDQYEHIAAVYVLAPDGRLARVLEGIDLPARQLKLAALDAADGKIGSLADRFLLTCYRWDPATRRYGPFITGFLRVGGAILVVLVGGLIVWLVVLERRTRRRRTA